MADDRLGDIERQLADHGTQIAILDERQARMHEDLKANTEAVRALTNALAPINDYISNAKGGAIAIGVFASILVAMLGGAAWLWDHLR